MTIEEAADLANDAGAGPLAWAIYLLRYTAFAVSSALALHHLARLAREHVKVVLTGDGADETLGGYPWRHEPEASPRSLMRGLAMTVVRSLRGARAGPPGLGAELGGFLAEAGITHATLPPAVLATLDERSVSPATVMVTAGEACPPGHGGTQPADRRLTVLIGSVRALCG